MKENHPLISIVVITKNTPLLILKRCINSILEQTYKEIEILLLDANSMDSPYKLALQEAFMQQENLIYLEHPEGNEFVNGKNKAIALANGDYITFLFSQDTMPPKRLQKAVHSFEKKDNCIALCTAMTVQEKGLLECSEDILTSGQFQYLPQLIIKKTAFEKYGSFDPNFIALCDEELWFRISHYDKINYLFSEECKVHICMDDEKNYSDYDAAIACRQFIKRYEKYYKTHIPERKERYRQAAAYYKKANCFFRSIQFYFKSISIFRRFFPEKKRNTVLIKRKMM